MKKEWIVLYRVVFISEASYGNKYYTPSKKEFIFSEAEYRIFEQSVRIVEKIDTNNPIATKEILIADTINRIKGSAQDFDINQEKIQENIKKAKRILVIKSYGIGNLINITPLLIKLKELTEAEIDFLGEKQARELFKGWDLINNIYVYPDDKLTIKNNKYDFILNGIMDVWNLEEIFPSQKIYRANDKQLYYMSEIETNMQVLKIFGWDGKDIPHTYIPISLETQKKINNEFGKKKLIGICSGYRKDYDIWKVKNWGYENYAKLIKKLLVKYPEHYICILGTDNDNEILKHINDERIIDCVNKYSIQETAQILKLCDFLVCNDTGLGHVSSAVDTKTYSIFGATLQLKNAPQNNNVIISRHLVCQPCQYDSEWGRCHNNECMNIPADEVFDVITGEQKKYELGIIIPIFNRYFMTITALDSLLNCELKNVKVVIVNDGSTDKKVIDLINVYKNVLEKNNNKVVIINHPNNYGFANYWRTVRDGFDNCYDCDYALYYANDIIVNKELLKVIKKSYKYFSDTIKCIQYFRDCRERKWGSNNVNKEYNIYFDYYFFDGVLGLFKMEDIKKIKFDFYGTLKGAWQEIDDIFKKNAWETISLKETLAEHIGNIQSVMHPEYRDIEKLYAINLNLWKKPQILNE